MRRLFGCPDIVSLIEKFLMAKNFYRIFTESNPVMGDSKTFGIPEAKGLSGFLQFISSYLAFVKAHWKCAKSNICIEYYLFSTNILKLKHLLEILSKQIIKKDLNKCL